MRPNVGHAGTLLPCLILHIDLLDLRVWAFVRSYEIAAAVEKFLSQICTKAAIVTAAILDDN
jgi:hypothetical protein